ncbi:MAG TPA: c-type cytochrome [Terriglobia bacterium]|nr:c-type cytochrome [Terriglobia bacterium]
MSQNLRHTLLATALLVLTTPILMLGQSDGPGAANRSMAAPHEGPAASQRFKNLQVLNNVPADQIFPAMQFITASLGVECEFCHVEHAFDKDDKPEKRTARKMMTMMFAIDKANFNGRQEVTCYTCHQGSSDPRSTPIIADTEPKPEAEEASAGPRPALPNAGEILDKYVQAIGGSDALHKITTRVERGTLTGFGPGMPVEVLAKAPDARVTLVQTPRGQSVTAYNGQTGWMSGVGPARPITGGELDNEKRNADFYFAANIKTEFQQIRVVREDKVGDHEAYVLMARNPGHTPVRFYFDKDSGLLLREMRFVETPLGRNPSEVDYADYRESDGVKIPYQWTIARPGGRFTIKIAEVQQNVPIDDSKFAAPQSPSGADANSGTR